MSTQTAVNSAPDTARSGARVSLKLISALLVVLALGITGYMTYTKIVNLPLPCSNEGIVNCAVVENSAWAYIMGIPTATWGMLAHIMIGSVLFLEGRSDFFTRNGVFIIFGIALFGVVYHSYLIYVSFAILRAVCPWCLAAAATMLTQLVVTSLRMRKALAAS